MSRQPTAKARVEPARPLTDLQLQLLELYGTDLPEDDLREIKGLLAQFFARKSIAEADEIWDERSLTNEDMDSWLDE